MRLLSLRTAFSRAAPNDRLSPRAAPPRIQWRYRSGFAPDSLSTPRPYRPSEHRINFNCGLIVPHPSRNVNTAAGESPVTIRDETDLSSGAEAHPVSALPINIGVRQKTWTCKHLGVIHTSCQREGTCLSSWERRQPVGLTEWADAQKQAPVCPLSHRLAAATAPP